MLAARIAVTSILVSAVVIATAGSAWSELSQQPTTSGQNNGGTISVGAGNTGNPSGGGPSSGGGSGGGGDGSDASSCQWAAQGTQGPSDPSQVGGYSQGGNGPPTSVAPTEAGTWYLEVCPGQNGDLIFVPQGASVATVVTPQRLATAAQNQLTPAAPVVQLDPAADAAHWQWVHVPTWAWVPAADWVPLTATASVPGVVVTATATPVELDITYFDDGWYTVNCDGPGTPYSDGLAAQIDPTTPLNAPSPTCGWTYQNSSAGQPGELVPVSARIVYHASWTVTGAAGGGDLGTVTSPAATFSVKVAEVQTIIVR